MESFVDLVYCIGACGEIVTECLRHKVTGEAQLFGHGTLFLAEFLAEDALAQRARLRQLLAVPVPAAVRDFPRGRRAFAERMTAWYDAPNQPLPPRLLACLRREAADVPGAGGPLLPVFYNFFPVGYHFFVAEGLFLTGQFVALFEWLELTEAAFLELTGLDHNVYNELLRAFRAVALLRTGRFLVRAPNTDLLFQLEAHGWLAT